MPTPRLFLFHGADSFASQKHIKHWEELFLKKHGEATRYIIEADELSSTQVQEQLLSFLQGQTLFAAPTLIIVKRLLAQEKGNSQAFSGPVLIYLKKILAEFTETITLAFWEGSALKSNNPFLVQFKEWQESQLAKIYYFPVPLANQISKTVAGLLPEGVQLAPAGLYWLTEQYRIQEQYARLKLRLKAADELLEDERTWWLAQILEGAFLRSNGRVISKEDLLAEFQSLTPPAGVFEIVQVIERGQWSRARKLLNLFEYESAETNYYNLLAALRWQLKKQKGGRAEYLERLLAELEIIAKNYSLSWSWLLEVCIVRLELYPLQGNKPEIINSRKLWLAHRYRS